MSNGKAAIICLIVGLIRKMLLNEILLKEILLKAIPLHKMSQYFLKPSEPFGGEISIKLDLSNYITKADLEGETGVDASNPPSKSDLASLKAGVDKIEIVTLKTDQVD